LAGAASPVMELARLIALTHHERWDGSGYPAGLVGDDIPLASRIVGILDMFESMTAERPYRPGWSIENAVAFIRDNAGRQLDPTLVAIFCRELPTLLMVAEQGDVHA